MNIFCLQIDTNYNAYQFKKLLKYVSPKRQERISRYHFKIDQKLSLYASLLIKMKLIDLFDIPEEKIVFKTNSYGKPYLTSYPNIYFNFSHTRNYIVCGISTKATLGIDVEKVHPPLYDIMDICFHPFERKLLLQEKSEKHSELFYKIWTRKEAYLKQCGTGLTNQLTTINTLDESESSNFHTWIDDNYICSVYQQNLLSDYNINKISENCINAYYLHNIP